MEHLGRIAVIALALGGLGAVGFQGQAPPARIGTLHGPSIVVAYYGSDLNRAHMKELHAKRDRARADGDRARVKELEAEGERLQDLAHRQLEGKAPIDEILAALKERLPAAAKEAGVQAIVERVTWAAPGVEVVDVTDAVVAQLHPSEKTLQWIRDLREKK
jgi:hypothetical protein